MTTTRTGPLPATEECRISYATVVAMMAAADDVIAVEEMDELRELCRSLELDERKTDEILAAANNRDQAAFDAAIERMKTSNLRFTLLADCIALAYADDEMADAEMDSLEQLAKALAITPEQFESLKDYAAAARKAAEGADANHEETGRKLAGRMASVGIPVGVLGLGSALGLTATGAMTGLAALAAGLGIATGFGAVLGLGIGTVYGLKWLKSQVLRSHAPAKTNAP